MNQNINGMNLRNQQKGQVPMFDGQEYRGQYVIERLAAWLADDKQTAQLGKLPAYSVVTTVRLQVTEAFNSDGSDLISVGYSGAATAFATTTDVSTTGIKSPTLGSSAGYNSTARDVEAYYTNGGSEPSTGKALVVLEYYRIPTPPA